MRAIWIVTLFGLSVVTESNIEGVNKGDILTEDTVMDLCWAGIPVLNQS